MCVCEFFIMHFHNDIMKDSVMEDQRVFQLTELRVILFKKEKSALKWGKIEGFHCNVKCLKILFLTVKGN